MARDVRLAGLRQTLWNALQERRLEAAVEHDVSLLAEQYLLPDAHYVASVAFEQLGDTGRAAFLPYVFDVLLESVGDPDAGPKNRRSSSPVLPRSTRSSLPTASSANSRR